MFGKHLTLLVLALANSDYKVSSLPVVDSTNLDNLLTPDVLPNFNGVIGGGHFNLLDLDDTSSANRRLAKVKATDFDPATVVEVLEKLKNVLNAAQIEDEHDTDSRRANEQSRNSKHSKNDNSQSKSSKTVNNKNGSSSNSSTGNDKTQSSKSSSSGNNKNQPSKPSSSGNNKNQSAQSNKNQSSQSNQNQSSKSNKNQSSQSNQNQSSQSNKNQSAQSNKNQSAQSNKNQSAQSNKNQSSHSNKNQSAQSNNNQSSHSNQNQSSNSNKKQSSQSNKNQTSQSNKNQSSQSNKNKSSQSGKNESSQSNKNKSSQSGKNESSQSNKNKSSKNDKNKSSKSSNSGNGKSQSKQTQQNPRNSKNGQVNKGSNDNGKGKPEKKGNDSKNNSKNPSQGGKKDKGNNKGKNNLPDDKKSSNKSNVLDLLDNKGFVKDLVNYTKKVMAERDFDLLVNTDLFLTIFKEDYKVLAEVAEDNDDWEKYIKSAIENFYLEFNKIYYNLVHMQSDNSSQTDQYNKAYDLAMFMFASRKSFNAVKLAAPVRRIADLIKSIIGGPIEMIQTSCKNDMPIWQCNIAYISKLIAAAESCPNIWFHSLVLETMLEYNRVQTLSIGDPIKKILVHMKSKESPNNLTQAYKAFEYIMKILLETKETAKRSLQLRAKLYQFITDLQNDGSLDCNNIRTPLFVL